MPMMRCPQHGLQLGGHACVHVESAVSDHRPLVVYVRQLPLTVSTVCEPCAHALDRGEGVDGVSEVICDACADEWAGATGQHAFSAWGAEQGEGGPFSPV